LKNIGKLAWSLARKLDVQAIVFLLKLDLPAVADQLNRPDRPLSGHSGLDRLNHRLSLGGPAELDGIQDIAPGSEAEVFRSVGSGVCVIKRSFRYLGRAFSVDLPRARPVDGVAVHLQPRPNVAQYMLHFVWDRSVRARPDVHQEVAVLAHHVDQLMHDELRLLKGVVLVIAPG